MIGAVPPYSLDKFAFSFPALALCAGSAQLGGDRDLDLAVFQVARLAVGLLAPVELDLAAVTARAERAQLWLSGLTMPQPARMALVRVIDATVAGPDHTALAIGELAQTVVGHIDAPSQQALSNLVTRLRTYPGRRTE